MRDFMPCKGCDEPEACEIEGRCLEPAQEPVAWYWQHVMQESKGVIESGFSGTRVEPTDDAMWNGKVATVVTELHAGRKLLPPKFAAAVGQPTEIPPAGVKEPPHQTFPKDLV